MAMLITGACIIDGVGEKPLSEHSIWIEKGRIKAIGRSGGLDVPPSIEVIDGRGKYVIPGLMNANVHLLCDIRLENLARYWGRYEELIVEAAQLGLRYGLTTVFDTWGPRRFLMKIRDRISAGEIVGSRIFCGGNIVGFEGPFSADFYSKAAEVASPAFVRRVNAVWVENVGRHLMWLPPEGVAGEVRRYIAKGVDFIKFASNEHFGSSSGAFLSFTPRVQRAIVEEAHRAGMTAQAHTMSIEGLHAAAEAGCDLIQHVNHTGPVTIPEIMLDRLAERGTGCIVFPFTERSLKWLAENEPKGPTVWKAADMNVRNLIRCGAPLLLGNDASLLAPEALGDPMFARTWMGLPNEDSLFPFDTGHFAWLRAMEEKGCPPMQLLRAVTRNVAVAYGKGHDLGTLEEGKIADMVLLDKNPLENSDNYRSINRVIKNGELVDRDRLPEKPLLTRPMESMEEESAYISPMQGGRPFPLCVCPGD